MVSNCGSNYDGALGDSSGREYSVQPWYSRPWNCVLRFPDAQIRSTISRLAIDAANNNNIGYDWGGSSMGVQLAKVGYEPSKITVKCGADCSGSTSYIINAAGHLCNNSKLASYPKNSTRTMRSSLQSIGFILLTDSKYLTSDKYLLEGDVLLNDNHHVCINVGNGVSASSDTSWGGGSSNQLYQTQYTREDGIIREFAYLDKKNEISLKKSKQRVSIINYTAMLQTMTDSFGLLSGGSSEEGMINVSTGGTGAPLKGRSGNMLTVKKTIAIPSNVRSYLHSGDDCTDYSYWSRKLGWTQGKVAKVWRDMGQPHDSRHIGLLGGHLTIAMKDTFGAAGDLVQIYCDSGLKFSAVLVDIKGSDANSRWGHPKGNDVSPCEWYIWTANDSVNSVQGFPGIGDWKGKKVVKVENYGSWLNG